ncbi:MAG: hypothetical protein R6X31_00795 [Anaerolineae bacterium]
MPSFRKLLGTEDAKPLTGEELEQRRQERDEMLERIDIDKLNEKMREQHGG